MQFVQKEIANYTGDKFVYNFFYFAFFVTKKAAQKQVHKMKLFLHFDRK